MQVQTISIDSPYFDQTIALWKQNRRYLGIFPAGAFRERALANQIIGAISDGVLLGYLIYFTSNRGKHARVTHLCVDKRFQKNGVARRLVRELVDRTRSCLGITLYCRSDFPAASAWVKLGFAKVGTKSGKSGKELVRFHLSHGHPDLFQSLSDERLSVVLDTSVFLDLVERDREGARESAGLQADWLEPLIRLCCTHELLTDIHNQSDSEQRQRNLSFCRRHFEVVDADSSRYFQCEEELKALFGTSISENDSGDIRQLARTIASGITVFVSRDLALLRKSSRIYSRYGVKVVRPSQLIAQFAEILNEKDFQRDRLRGTVVTLQRTSDDSVAKLIHDNRSSIKPLESEIRNALSKPDSHRFYSVSRDGKIVAAYLYVIEPGGDIEVRILRCSGGVHSTSFKNSLMRTLLRHISQNAPPEAVIRVTDPLLEISHSIALDAGFVEHNGQLVKVKLTGCWSPRNVLDWLQKKVKCSEQAERLEAILNRLISLVETSDPILASSLEHLLWPAKLLGCGIRNYVVPIRQQWAVHLCDTRMANEWLLGADQELAFNADSVYYRSVRNAKLHPPGRLFWYVSKGNRKRSPGPMELRSCSRLTEVETGPWEVLFRKNRRLGVYGKREVEKIGAKSNGMAMSIHFDDTEQLKLPMKFRRLESILQEQGVRSKSLIAPVEIPETLFHRIYLETNGFT